MNIRNMVQDANKDIHIMNKTTRKYKNSGIDIVNRTQVEILEKITIFEKKSLHDTNGRIRMMKTEL